MTLGVQSRNDTPRRSPDLRVRAARRSLSVSASIKTLSRENSFSLIDTTMPAVSS
jgi:hypothetical protein